MKYLESLMLLILLPIFAQGADLDLVKTASTTSVNTGVTFTYTLQYRCASTTENCTGVVITDPLPASVEYVSLAGSIHTTNEQYNASSHTVTFTLDNPLIAGTVGQVSIVVRFPNGSTPNGTVANNTATISGTNAASVSSSAAVSAVASERHSISKGALGGTPDEVMVYSIRVENSSANGTLNLNNVVVTDPLPLNTIYNSSSNGGVYNASTNTVTWTLTSLNIGQRQTLKVVLTFPSTHYSVGNNITNTATSTFTPVGESQMSESASATHTLFTPYISSGLEKTSSDNTFFRETTENSHTIKYFNYSNIPISNFYIEDNFPTGLEPIEISTGNFYSGIPGANLSKTIKYKTNLNSTWQTLPVSTNLWTSVDYNVSGLGLATNEHITTLRWEFGPDPWPIGSGGNNIEIKYTIPSNAPLGAMTNCAIAGGDTITWMDYYQDNNCHDFIIDNRPLGYLQHTRKRHRPQGSSTWSLTDGPNFNVGDVVEFDLMLRNNPTAASDIPNPAIADLLPEGLEYVDGSWSFSAGSSGLSTPTFTKIDNYNGTGKTYLRWDFNGNNLSPNKTATIKFEAIISNKAGSGEDAFRNEYAMLNPISLGCEVWGSGGQKVDSEDIDNDGNTTEELCFGYAYVDVTPVPALSSEKFIKGQLDANYTKYPDFGNAVPGGVADYRLVVRNDGNVPIKNIQIVDILPFVGDAGVIDLSPRNSRWRPNLAGAVSAPTGVIVYYSTEGNPCRSAEGIEPNGPVGCNSPDWTTSVPTDITTVQSLKFDFGSFTLEPSDSIILEWPMRAPVNTLQTVGNISDTIAWASFGYVGTRTDNDALLLAAEPLKVGMRMQQFVPAVIGNQVWLDNNLNGIQDNGEVGLDGVRVELYRDNGDGIANPNTDILEAFTVTGNGGFYLFPNLSADNYFVQFYLPPNHDLTLANQGGNDVIDSDVTATTYNGFSTAITPIINLNTTDVDLDWDMGIYPNNKTSIGNYVWIDDNGDGIQNEPSNFGVNGLTVNLYQSSNLSIPFQSTTTRNDINGVSGFYEFRNLPPGGYVIELALTNGITTTTKGPTGTSDANDSDINTNGRTDLFTFFANDYDDTWDMGIIVSGTEICNNLVDDDGDGDIDCEDSDCAIPTTGAIIMD